MRARKLLAACIASCLVVLAGFAGVALAGEAGFGGAEGIKGSPLVIPAAQELLGGEQLQAQREVELDNPIAVDERKASRTRYERLGAAAAIKLAKEKFPGIVDHMAGGPPSLPAGERILSYKSPTVAVVGTSGGHHEVMESLTPMAIAGTGGHLTPINLALRHAGDGYEPTVSNIGVQIPEKLSRGVRMAADGVSLTPVDASGRPLEGSPGAPDGTSVLYANTQTDTDTLAKPASSGFEIDSLLRSVNSPTTLYFQIGMPAGAHLVDEKNGSRGVRVLLGGKTIAMVPPPTAQDAQGTFVPVRMNLVGKSLVVNVDASSHEYKYPIDVDPYAWDKDSEIPSGEEESTKTDWQYHETVPGKFGHYSTGYGYVMFSTGNISAEERDEFVYGAHGQAAVTYFEGEDTATTSPLEWAGAITKIEYVHEKTVENQLTLAGAGQSYSKTKNTFGDQWVESEKNYHALNNGNVVRLSQMATKNAPEGYGFWFELNNAWIEVYQEKGPEVSFEKSKSTITIEGANRENVLYGSGGWLSSHNGAVEVVTKDPGLGVSDVTITDLTEGPHGHWSTADWVYGKGYCTGIWCKPEDKKSFTYSEEMAEGPNTFEVCAENQAAMRACTTTTVNVDNTAPRESSLKLSGIAETGAELSATQHEITAEATDPNSTGSGIKSISVFIDGKEVGKPSGFCSPGECTASGTWTIDGEALGAGEHKLGIRATDNADNISNEKLYTFSIRNAPPMKIGPGTVDPVTGQLGLSASDASLAGVGSVSRAYLSRYAQSFSEAAGVESPLGPQWSFSVGDGLTLNVLPSGSVELRERGGEPTTYLYSEKTYHAPKGDENLKLESKEKEAGHGITEYILTNEAAGRSTTFTLPSKSSTWVPAYSEAAESREKVQYAYRTYEVELPRHVRYLATEPTEVLAPVPAGVACGKNPSEVKLEELKAGCRAFSFTYAETTTAKGENSNEWGEYRGLLSTVSITTYNPSSTVKAMVTTPVAKYAYDQNGRLRSEWDPRISPSPLKTTYGYDNYGDISTVSGPGQQPSLIHYGTTSTDNSIARVLSIARPLASVALGNGNIPVNTKTPTLSTTSPVVGTTLSVSNGEWTNLPLNYTYHWDDCTTTNAEACTRIDGAVNQTYTPQPRDAGFRIVAYVTAENGTGAPAAASAVSNPIPLSTPKFSSTLTGALTIGEAKSVAVTPAGNLWFTDNNQRIVEESSSGALIRVVGWGVIDYAEKFEICTSSCHAGIAGSGNGQFYRPWGIAVNPTTGNIYVGDQENERIEEFNEKGEFIRAFGKYGTGHGLLSGTTGGIAIDAAGHVWIADYGNNLVQEFSETGTYMTEIGNSTGLKLTEPIGVAVSGEEVYVVEAGEARIYVYNTSGTLLTRWGKPGSGEGELEFGSLEGIAREATTGDLYVTDCTKNRIQVLNPAGKYVTKFGASGTEGGQFACPVGISFDGSNNIYVADSKNKRIQKWTPAYSTSNPVPSAPSAGSNAITTIEYGVPLYGTGAPFQMTSGELAKWGQEKDLPGQATAVFPPDEPMGWPASGYKRATVEYLDPESRLVNVATPNGGITTSEYNTDNEVTRTLSAADRATAIKEGGKSAEVAASLSSESIYAENGTQLKETIGPEHKVRLPNGEEEETRDRQEFAYNEGHPSEEAQYDLLTKKVSLAESTVGKKVLERHETATSYAGSGWKLREPTAVTSTVEGQATTKLTTYEKETGLPKEVLASVSLSAPPYALQFGASGTGNGQMKTPGGTALDSHGDLWVVDRGNNRVEEFSSLGQFITAYGSEGTGASQFKAPQGIAINQSTGNVYVTDSGNNRVEELSSEGKFVAAFGFGVGTGESKYEICTSACRAGIAGSGGGQFNNPVGVTVSASGVLWVVDRGNNRIEKFSSANGYLSTYGSSGTGEVRFKEPAYIAISGNELYVTDSGNHRVEELSETGKYVSQFGSSGSGNGQFGDPYAIAADPGTGALYVGDLTNNRVEQFSEAGLYMSQFGTSGTGNGQFKEPVGISVNAGSDVYVVDSANARVEMWEQMRAAPVFSGQFGNGDFSGPSGSAIDAHGDLWVANAYGNQIEEFSSTGVRLHVYSEWGAGAGQVKEPIGMAVNQGTGIVYVGDGQNNRVDEFNEKGEFVSAFGYGVTDGAEKLETCTSTCRAGLSGGHAGEFHEAGWVAVDTSGNIWVGDESNNRVQEFNSKSEFLRTFGFGVTNGKSEFEVCTSSCQTGIAGSGSGQLSNPTGIAVAGGHVYVGDLNNNRVEMFSTEGAYLGQFGSSGSGNGQFNQPDGVAADAAGNVYVSDIKNNRVEEFTASGAYLRTIGSKGSGNGELSEPLGVTVVGFNIYIADAGNNRVDQWGLAPSPGNEGASNSKTIYYTAATNSEYENCGKHPEWATLVCQTERTVQPGDSGPPSLPVTTYVYNIWDEPEEIVEKVVSEKLGPVTRTTKKTFDAAGRETASEETTTSSEDSSLPSVTNEYNSETGAFVKQVEILKGEEKAITLAYNTLGQLTSYTDASGATTKYAYDVDGRIEEVTEPKGRQVYSYDPTSGFLTKLLDTSAGTFTASYNSEGKMLTEGYPNGMTSTYSYDSLGRPTNLEYEKTTHCSEKCILFSDSEAYNAGGQVAYQASSLASENYTYNESGQLTKTQETPVAGEGCVTRTRLYGYSEETGERESLTSREPNEKHECMAEGGVVEGHFYDAVGRLLDPGVTYDSLGNMTKVPVADSGGLPITSAFYVDGQVVTQEQNEKAIGYTYDPAGRTMTAALKTKSGTVTTISHYAGPGNALTWTCEEAGGCKEEKEGKWSRDIPGIDGELDAIQENGGAPTLQLHDLQGDVVATAPDSETEAKLINTYTSTEFGVPVGTRPKYSWLGARGVDSELGTGVVTSGGGTYVPQAAQVLQTNQVIPPGAAPNGTLTSETYRPPAIEWLDSSAAEEASNTLAEQRMTEAQAELAADGEGEDPTFYYTRAEALQRGKKLEALTFYSEYVDLVGTVWEGLEEGVVKFLEGALTDKLDGVDKSFAWFSDTGKELVSCASEALICKISYKEWTLKSKTVTIFDPFTFKEETIWEFKLQLIDPFSPAVVQWCLGDTTTNHGGCYSNK